MRRKLRTLTIDGAVYLYRLSNHYHSADTSTLTLKVFLSGHKQTPLVIAFTTLNHYFVGQPLLHGVLLGDEVVNLNRPKYIRALILQGISNGWTGTNRLEGVAQKAHDTRVNLQSRHTLEVQNGLEYLKALGYPIDVLLPPQKW